MLIKKRWYLSLPDRKINSIRVFLKNIYGHRNRRGVSFSPNGQIIAEASADKRGTDKRAGTENAAKYRFVLKIPN